MRPPRPRSPKIPPDQPLTGENPAPPTAGEARPALQRPPLPLPHENDQSTRAKGHPAAKVVKRAQKDLEEGRQDTEERSKAAEHFDRRWTGRRTPP